MAARRTPRRPRNTTGDLLPVGLADVTAAPGSEARERLLDLAYDVSSRLRHHVQPAVRVSAALLVAASLAACDGDPSGDMASPPPTVQPLQQEIATGLPGRPGRYPIAERSLQRDQQGVYHFGYREPGQVDGPGTAASASRIRLNQSNTEMLEIPAQGDPILHLRDNSEILLASAATQGTPTSSTRGSSSYPYWRPMYSYAGGGPAYYDPPSSVPSGASTVDDARRSTSLAPPASRTFGVSHAVSGRAGGTGGGTAASARAGADVSGGKSGVASSSSSGFSSGGAATAKGGGGSASS